MKAYLITLTLLFIASQYLLAFVIGKTVGIKEEREKNYAKAEKIEDDFKRKELNLKQRITDLETAFNAYIKQEETVNNCRSCEINYD